MIEKYKTIMNEMGYNHLVCKIFDNWEGVKDEILLPERKDGSGNGTVHVFLGNADNVLRNEFSTYYDDVKTNGDANKGAVVINHYFLKSNVYSIIGAMCQFCYAKKIDYYQTVEKILKEIEKEPSNLGLFHTKSLFKLSMGSNKLRPYFKQFDSDGIFHKVIRLLLIPKSAYRIYLLKNDNGEYAAFWLIGFNDLDDFEVNSTGENLFNTKKSSKLVLQQIYYGAPGTGKSHTINKITKDWNVIRTTFHPDSDYSTFVGAYKPTVEMLSICDEAGQPVKISNIELQKKQITYKFVRQAFLNAYLSAWKKYADGDDGKVEPQFLIIEEINRGNCAQIFGDIFQLLDRADNGFSSYPIVADDDIRKSIEAAFNDEDEFFINSLSIEGAVKNYKSNYGDNLSVDVREGRILLLPPNLHIWATMNTSDQSLFPIDSAFKRRWDWKFIKITNAYEKDDNGQYKTDEQGNKIPLNWKIKINETTEKDWWVFLDKINVIISNMTSSADKQLGYFFCKADENKVISVEQFVNKVVFYLWNDVFKDYGFEDSSLFLVKVKDKDGKDIGKDLTYPDFFDEDGKVNEEITIQFVDNVIKWSKKNENNL